MMVLTIMHIPFANQVTAVKRSHGIETESRPKFES